MLVFRLFPKGEYKEEAGGFYRYFYVKLTCFVKYLT